MNHYIIFVLKGKDAEKIAAFEKNHFTLNDSATSDKKVRTLFADNADMAYPVSMLQALPDCLRFCVQMAGVEDEDIFSKAVDLKMELESKWGDPESVLANLNGSNLPSDRLYANLNF